MKICVDASARDIYGKELQNGFRAAREGDAGIDLRASAAQELLSGETAAIPLGVSVALMPETVGWLTGRSSMAMRGLVVHEGTIDSGFRGQLHAIVTAVRDDRVVAGERIVQLVQLAIRPPRAVLVDELGETERGEAGFGSTGSSS